MSKDIMKVITQVDFYGKILNVYGLNKRDAYEKPKFYPVEIANTIDHTNSRKMLKDADLDDEDIFEDQIIAVTFSYGTETRTRKQSVTLVSEDGLYDILMNSNKPIAKEWKKEVKRVLKEYRLSYQDYIFTGQRFKSAKDHNELHDLIGDKGKCINLDKFLYNLCSYLLDLPEINRKDAIYQLKKSNITLYNQIMSSAYSYIKSYKRINKEHFIGITKEALLEEFVDDIDKYNEYISTHKVAKDEFVVQRGFGR